MVLAKPRHVYYLLNKPTGVVSTNRDPEGRPRVIDLVPSDKRLFTIGRLDRSSEGLIIVTNDGELANQMTHPRYGISKTYRAKVLGHPTAETMRQLREGVHLAEGLAQVESLKVRGRHPRGTELEIVLSEGRNREIRRILAKVGHKVQQLRRTAMGPLRLGKLKSGEYRLLTSEEVRLLQRTVKKATGTSTTPKTSSTRSRAVRASQAGDRSRKIAKPGRKPAKRKPVKGKPVKGKAATGRPVKGKPVKGKPVKGKPVRGKPVKGKPVKGRAAKGKRAGDSARTGTVLDYDQPQGASESRRSANKSGGKGKRR